MEQTIGIDFGTAFITAVHCTPAAHGGVRLKTLTRRPAIARMLHGGGALCGDAAFEARSAYRLSTIDQVKRVLGRTTAEIAAVLPQVSWTLLPDAAASGGFRIDAWTGAFEPEQIAAEILADTKAAAERELGQRIDAAVLTISAAATNRQRLALKEAARRAGLAVRRIVNDPTAIALAEAHLRPANGRERWGVVNVGAGASDVAIIDVGGGGVSVKSAAGDMNVGVASIRARLLELIEQRFRATQGIFLDTRAEIRAELLWIADETLQALCRSTAHTIDLRAAATHPQRGALDLCQRLERRDLESVSRSACRRLRELAREALRRADTHPSGIHRILFTGGGAYLPPLRRALADVFRQAARTGWGVRNVSWGVMQTRREAPGQAITPAEWPAAGAAILGASLDGRVDVHVQDVLARSLGVRLVHDRFSRLLPAGTVLPARNSSHYTTVEDYQDEIRFEVREGEEPVASRNAELGAFVLSGIQRALAGKPSVRVTFDIDESGILNVHACDVDTQAQRRVTIERAAH
ncbi:MAG TPA: Hsp70 family protein [Planctomycetota bacterium]|nr:Hsp70 family protein [Planctomycetota bacterium]